MAKDHVPYNITNKDLYLLLSNGILTNKGQAFFYLEKDGIKCCMLSARSVLKASDLLKSFRWICTRKSRVCGNQRFTQQEDNTPAVIVSRHRKEENQEKRKHLARNKALEFSDMINGCFTKE